MRVLEVTTPQAHTHTHTHTHPSLSLPPSLSHPLPSPPSIGSDCRKQILTNLDVSIDRTNQKNTRAKKKNKKRRKTNKKPKNKKQSSSIREALPHLSPPPPSPSPLDAPWREVGGRGRWTVNVRQPTGDEPHRNARVRVRASRPCTSHVAHIKAADGRVEKKPTGNDATRSTTERKEHTQRWCNTHTHTHTRGASGERTGELQLYSFW